MALESHKHGTINQDIRQGCPLLPGHLKIYTNTAMDEWPGQIRTNLHVAQWILHTLLLEDYQTISG